MRIQFGGPWTAPDANPKWAYRHTHWVASRYGVDPEPAQIFDVNAMIDGGWIYEHEWSGQLIPWLIKETTPRADGTWWPTHCWEVLP